MRTLTQQNASRINGAKSRGPVTAEGKARVSQNGTKHGIYSKRAVLAGEDPQAFDDLQQSLVRAWGPVNDFEHNLITDIAEARWRLARFITLETAAIDLQVNMMRPALDEEWPEVDLPTRYILGFNELITSNRSFEVLQAAIRQQHRVIDRATSQLIKLHKMRPNLPSDTGNPAAQPQNGANEPGSSIVVTAEQLAAMVNAAVSQRLASVQNPAAMENSGTKPEASEAVQPQPTQAYTQNHESKPEHERRQDTQTGHTRFDLRGMTRQTGPNGPGQPAQPGIFGLQNAA